MLESLESDRPQRSQAQTNLILLDGLRTVETPPSSLSETPMSYSPSLVTASKDAAVPGAGTIDELLSPPKPLIDPAVSSPGAAEEPLPPPKQSLSKVATNPLATASVPLALAPSSILAMTTMSIISSIPLVSRGWQVSEGQPGTVNDSDFWFLLQSTIVALLGLYTMGVPLVLKEHPGQGPDQFWTWSFVVMAAICTILAPCLYTTIRTEFSACIAAIGSFFQALVTVQLALIASRGDKSKVD